MKSTNCKTLQLVSLHRLFYLTELNKDDSSHSSGTCLQILVHRCDINFNQVLFFFFLATWLAYLLLSHCPYSCVKVALWDINHL